MLRRDISRFKMLASIFHQFDVSNGRQSAKLPSVQRKLEFRHKPVTKDEGQLRDAQCCNESRQCGIRRRRRCARGSARVGRFSGPFDTWYFALFSDCTTRCTVVLSRPWQGIVLMALVLAGVGESCGVS